MAQAPNKTLRMDEEETFETGEAITLEDGAHRGTIISVHGERTQEGYEYLQLVIQPDEADIKLRYGCPFPNRSDDKNPNSPRKPVTPASKLGKLLLAFGKQVPGPALSIKDMRELMENRKVNFLTVNEAARKGTGTFANIVEDSIKPVKA